jgi:hypothetical protein
MAGQIIPRGDRTWLVRVFIGRDSETGKRQYQSKTIHGTKKDAQRYLTESLRDRDMGIVVEPEIAALGRYLDKWLETSAKPRLRAALLFAPQWSATSHRIVHGQGKRKAGTVVTAPHG